MHSIFYKLHQEYWRAKLSNILGHTYDKRDNEDYWIFWIDNLMVKGSSCIVAVFSQELSW